jgi:hypothetical protein
METVTYLLVDFENLQPPAEHVAKVRGDSYRLWVFHGPHQNKFASDLVKAWQPLGDRVCFVQSSKAGKNALDFHIAFCLGQVQQQDADAKRAARYIVVTQDGGFDPLFEHMRLLGCAVGKAKSIPAALALAKQLKPGSASRPRHPGAAKKVAVKKATKKTAGKAATELKNAAKNVNGADAFDKLLAHLRAHPKNRPTTEKSLANHIPNMVGGTVTEKEVTDLMTPLLGAGVVTITGQKIEYRIPKSGK